ncbi:MAG: protein tyrosine phosphatase [Planctomycetota bacterium]
MTSNDIRWADVVFVMERWHHNRLRQMFANVMRNKRVICLDIPDNYKYMDSALVEQLTVALSPHIELPAS